MNDFLSLCLTKSIDMRTIKIAPDLNEITMSGNVMSTKFNGMKIEYIMSVKPDELSEDDVENLKRWLQAAIGMSSKSWQIGTFMDELKVDGRPLGRVRVERLQ